MSSKDTKEDVVDQGDDEETQVREKKGEVGEEVTSSAVEGSDDVIESNWAEVVKSFDGMGLQDDLLRGIYAYGFERPSAIQQRGIMPILAGHDTIAQAQSGTGKTATFSISVLQLIDTKFRQTQALILAPARELAQQIQKVASQLGEYLKITTHACVGGTLVRDDIRILREGVQVCYFSLVDHSY